MSESDPYFDVIEPRKPGRPRKPEPGSTLSVWIPAKQHEYYAKLARLRGESVSRTVKSILDKNKPTV
jgi:hypothetical protein